MVLGCCQCRLDVLLWMLTTALTWTVACFLHSRTIRNQEKTEIRSPTSRMVTLLSTHHAPCFTPQPDSPCRLRLKASHCIAVTSFSLLCIHTHTAVPERCYCQRHIWGQIICFPPDALQPQPFLLSRWIPCGGSRRCGGEGLQERVEMSCLSAAVEEVKGNAFCADSCTSG